MLRLRESLQKTNSGYKGVGNLLQSKNENEPTWNLLKETVSLPAATLSRSALNHNQSWMEKFAEKYQFQLAPHGKTTMLPSLFKMQVASPCCWGMTLATVPQVTAAFKNGIKRVLMANQLVGRCNMDIISAILEKDPDFEFICLVDSSANVAQLGKFFQERKQKLKVLLEYGVDGGRTGIRNESQEKAVVDELKIWRSSISVVGVEFFEGVFQEEAEIRRFAPWALSRVEKLVSDNLCTGDEVIITGAGTSWLDVIAEDFLQFEKKCSVKVKKILRSGCYLIYDNGMYTNMEKRVLNMKLGEEQKNSEILSKPLETALKVWAYVQSIPEPNLAIIGMGRRDIGNDAGFPVPYLHYRPGHKAPTICNRNSSTSMEVFKLMDQHGFMRIKESDDLQVGDIIAFDIYHACTSMDKWRNVLLIDDDFNVLDVYCSDF